MGKQVFPRVSPWKKVIRFRRKGKVSPRFIGPCEVVEGLDPVAYQLKLPQELDKIHDVFHVSMLKRYCTNSYHIVAIDEIEVRPYLNYEEELVKIMAPEIKTL